MKTLIKHFYIFIIYALILIKCINLQFEQKRIYEEYNGMKGIVLSTFQSRSCIMVTVRLDNGIIESVNNRYETPKIGDVWVNRIGYSKFFGMVGYAYCIVPNNEVVYISSSLFMLINYMIAALFLIITAVKRFYMFIDRVMPETQEAQK